jgi:mono/diheme cytochrome c family protein
VKALLSYSVALIALLGGIKLAERSPLAKICSCWPPMRNTSHIKPEVASQEFVPIGSYGSEVDLVNPDHTIQLDYSEDQGKRLFYQYCVWCHADSTPAGPSNRSNVTPDPPILTDAAFLKGQSDAALEQAVALGGSAIGKSPMMPPYGSTLKREDILDLIRYMRKIAASSTAQASPNTQASTRSNSQ